MTNPYLERLRGRIQEKQDPSQPSKPSKPASEGFEGGHRRHCLENHCHDEKSNTAAKNLKSPTTADPQNLQNPRLLIVPDCGVGCRVAIVEIPFEAGRYKRTVGRLQRRPPALVDVARWQQCIKDGRRFLRQWGRQVQELNWSSADLFGLIEIPESPAPSFNRLSRYDRVGLCWLLQNREIVALTATTATIRNPSTGAITLFRKHHRPALGPLGDSLEDLK
jgi:hypothetical protein